MTLSIISKLKFLTGTLLLALTILGVSTFIQTGGLGTQLRHFAESDQPVSTASLEMAICASSAGYTLLQYLQHFDKAHLAETREEQSEFERLNDAYRQLAHEDDIRRLGSIAQEDFRRFNLLGDELIQLAGSRTESLAEFDQATERLNGLLADRSRMADSSDSLSPGAAKQNLALEMALQAARLKGDVLQQLHASEGQKEAQKEYGFPQLLNQYRALQLSPSESQWLAELDNLHGKSVQLAEALFENKRALSAKIDEVDAARDGLHKFLAGDVQKAVHEDMEKGKLTALRGIDTLRTVVICLFLLGAGAGVVTAVAIARSINVQQTTIRDAVARLQSISAEILASTSQQASGMEEQNASVSETVTTMSELGQTIEEAAERATTVREVVRKTVEAGNSGREAVQKSVSAMDKVRQQVNSIAKNNLGLAERAQAIGDIISTVNDVTDQTNLLALNAAVEAARAGEYGKGFGVVAAEIKSLAEQSRQATQQVSQILGDIQKATNAAVLATEQGTRDADEATRVVQEAGETISLLSHSLDESSRMAAQISASAGQQTVGIKQVNEAMGHLEMVAREQVAATRQVEAAMADLQNLSHQLADLVDERTSRSQETVQLPARPASSRSGNAPASTLPHRITRFSSHEPRRDSAGHTGQKAA